MAARSMFLLLLLAASSEAAHVTETTVCELMQNPERYQGRMVRFAAEWTRPPRHIAVDEPGGKCGPILIVLPDDSDLHPRARFKVVNDAQLKKFLDSAFVLVHDPKTFNTGKITATLQGRFDVPPPGRGFGHGDLFDFRLVLRQVSNVSVERETDH